MGLDNHIETAMKSVLRNPILGVLKEINITRTAFMKQLLPVSHFQCSPTILSVRSTASTMNRRH